MSRAAPSLPALFAGLGAAFPDRPALVDEHHGDRYAATFAELEAGIAQLTAGLAAVGLQSDEKVALFSENSHRWLLADQAIMCIGAAAAVRGVDAPADELAYIFDHSESVALVVEDRAVLDKLVRSGFDLTRARFVMLLYGEATEADCSNALNGSAVVFSFADIIGRGEDATVSPPSIASITRDSVATILYTSGTTGSPKGAVLTHGNLLSQLDSICIGAIDPVPGEIFVTCLPIWHMYVVLTCISSLWKSTIRQTC
jgi:long-chain acyl-CoA synthetase